MRALELLRRSRTPRSVILVYCKIVRTIITTAERRSPNGPLKYEIIEMSGLSFGNFSGETFIVVIRIKEKLSENKD